MARMAAEQDRCRLCELTHQIFTANGVNRRSLQESLPLSLLDRKRTSTMDCRYLINLGKSCCFCSCSRIALATFSPIRCLLSSLVSSSLRSNGVDKFVEPNEDTEGSAMCSMSTSPLGVVFRALGRSPLKKERAETQGLAASFLLP